MENKKLRKARNEYNTMVFISFLVIIVSFYFLLPHLLNFPKYFDNISFQRETIKIPLFIIFTIIGLIVFVFEKIIDKLSMKEIDDFINKGNPEKDKKFVINVRDECMNYPYKFMIIQLFVMIIILILTTGFLLFFGKMKIANFDKLSISFIRIAFLAVAIWLIISVFKYYFLQNYLNIVLKESYVNNRFYKKNNKIVSNSISVIMQILPLVIAIFIIFIGFSYSNTINVSSKAISTYYRAYLSDLEYDKTNVDVNELLRQMRINVPLWEDGNLRFVIDNNGNVTTDGHEDLSDFMLKYMNKYFYYYTDEEGVDGINLTQEDNIIYESYGIDEHAYVRCIKDNIGRKYYVGVKYFSGNIEAFKFLVYISIALLAVYTVILTYWARSNSRNIKNLEKGMQEILSDKDILKKNFMPILSNDEIGNVAYFYNKIQDKLLIQRDIMFKQEQLSVLGELARTEWLMILIHRYLQ